MPLWLFWMLACVASQQSGTVTVIVSHILQVKKSREDRCFAPRLTVSPAVRLQLSVWLRVGPLTHLHFLLEDCGHIYVIVFFKTDSKVYQVILILLSIEYAFIHLFYHKFSYEGEFLNILWIKYNESSSSLKCTSLGFHLENWGSTHTVQLFFPLHFQKCWLNLGQTCTATCTCM